MSDIKSNFFPQQNMTFATGAGSSAAAQTITQTLNDPTNPCPLTVLRIANASNGVAFVDWGGTNVVATTTTGFPVLASSERTICMGRPCKGVAAILGTGTGNVYISVGEGV